MGIRAEKDYCDLTTINRLDPFLSEDTETRTRPYTHAVTQKDINKLSHTHFALTFPWQRNQLLRVTVGYYALFPLVMDVTLCGAAKCVLEMCLELLCGTAECSWNEIITGQEPL